MPTDEAIVVAMRGPLMILKDHDGFWVVGPEVAVRVKDEAEGREFINLLYKEFGPKV